MSEERMRILNMLAEGTITPEQAERLLQAVAAPAAEANAPAEAGRPDVAATSAEPAGAAGPGRKPSYLRVIVQPQAGKKGERVNIRVPIQLLRAGIKLKGLIPEQASGKISQALRSKGIDFDPRQLQDGALDELVAALCELSLDVDDDDEHVRIFCE